MKRFLSIVLAMIMVLSMITPVFAYTDTKDNDYEAAISHLSGLGVINGYEDGSFKPKKVVTRAEMAKLLVVSLGLESGAEILKNTVSFNDVTADHWANGFINVAAQYGLIKGDGDGNFRPDDTVNYAEASTMCLRALGYNRVVDKAGEWPTNYLNKANELKLFEDLTFDNAKSGANRGTVAQMMWNMINRRMWEINFENETDGVSYKKGNTMLVTKFPYYSKVELDLKDGDKFNVKITGENTVEIDGIEYKNVNPLDLFDGEVFEAIIYKKNNDVIGKSLYIKSTNDDLDTTAVVGRVTKLAVGKIFVNDEAYTIKEEGEDYTFVEDSSAVKENSSNFVGSIVRLVIDEDNNVTEVEFLNKLSTNSILVDTIKTDKNDKVTYKAYNNSDSIEVEKDDDVIYVSLDENGDSKIVSASDIKQNSVLSEIFVNGENDENSLLKGGRVLVVSNNTVSGKLSKIENKRLIVDGKSYKLANDEAYVQFASKDDPENDTFNIDNIKDNDLIGEDVTLTLDYNNNVCLIEADDKVVPANYGFITKVFENTSGEDVVTRVKIVGLDGVATTYDAYDFENELQVEEGTLNSVKSTHENVKLVEFELKDGKIDMSADKAPKLASETLIASKDDAEVNKTRKTIKIAADTYVTTSSTSIINAGFEKDDNGNYTDKFAVNTVTFDDIADEVKDATARVIKSKENSVKLSYVVITGDVESDENFAVVTSDGISVVGDNKFEVEIYDVTSGEKLTVKVKNDTVGDEKGSIVSYTKSSDGTYTFVEATPVSSAAEVSEKILVEAGVGYTMINGANLVVTDDVKVLFLDIDGDLSDDAELSDIEVGYDIYKVEDEDISGDDKAATIIIVVEKDVNL